MKQTCGPGKLTFNFLPKYKACYGHDQRYEYTTQRNEKTRYKIDRIFLSQMLIEKPSDKFTAYIYYILVRLFGWIRFYNLT